MRKTLNPHPPPTIKPFYLRIKCNWPNMFNMIACPEAKAIAPQTACCSTALSPCF
uniref:Uncharacterized protein n=1 Tax=Anguilla anguilla TaxID=7936 RepID=A0A0E9PZZ3_ANGAN